jgi:O-antigen ligase
MNGTHGNAITWVVAIGVALMLALSPLSWWPQDPYGLIKNVVVELAAFLLAATWLCAALIRGEFRLKHSPLTLPLTAFFAWSCVSYLANPFKGYGGPRERELFAYLLIYLLTLNTIEGERQRKIIFIGAFAGVLGVSAMGIAQYFQLLPTKWEFSPWGTSLGQRVYATMLNPNILAGHIIAIFPLGLALFLCRWRGTGRLIGGAFLVLTYACLLLTVSWGGYAGFLASLLFIAFPRNTVVRRERVRSGKGSLCFALILVCMSFLFFSIRGRQAVSDTSGMNARLFIWEAGDTAIRERPVVGHGPANISVAIGEHLTHSVMNEYRKNPGKPPWTGSYRVRYLDGDFFGTAVEFGLVGLAFLAWIFVILFSEVRRGLRDTAGLGERCALLGLGGCAVALLVQSTVSYPLRVPPTAAFFFALLGIASAPRARRSVALPLTGLNRTLRSAMVVLLATGFLLLSLRTTGTLRGEMLLVRAFSYACRGQWQEAALVSDAALRYPITDPEAYNILGDALRNLNRRREASGAFEHLLRFDPSRPDTYIKLGKICENAGDEEGALHYYRRAVELERHDTPLLRLNLANLLEKMGSRKEAVRILREGVRLYPRNDVLRRNLQRISAYHDGR